MTKDFRKIVSLLPLSACMFFAANALVACGDDSGSNVPVVPASSQSVPMSFASTDPFGVESSSSEAILPPPIDPLSDAASSSSDASQIPVPTDPVLSSSSEMPLSSAVVPDPACSGTDPLINIPIDEYGFADIGDVYKSVRCNEKVVFVVRHAERDINDVSKTATITEEGVAAALAAGAKLIGEGDFQFSHTNYVRTEATCLNISVGRGQLNFVHDTISLYGSWYVKDEAMYDGFMDTSTTKLNVKTLVSDWAYTGRFGEAFYDLKDRSEEIISTYLAPGYDKMLKYHLICTHDDFVLPMAVYLTDKKVALKFYDKEAGKEKNWINYIAGFAIVLNDKNERRVYAIKGMEDGIY